MEVQSRALDLIPYDVLREIIMYNAVGTTTPYPVDHLVYLSAVIPPVVASHVCRSWRRGLLSDPTMWTYIIFPTINSDGVVELLSRSQSAPLSVFLQMRDDIGLACNDVPRFFSTLFQHMDRFRVLHIHLHSPDDEAGERRSPFIRQALSNLNGPAPRLETFSLWNARALHDTYGLDRSTFFRTLFSQHTPQLKNVHCESSTALRQTTSPLFRNLTQLHLVITDKVHSGRFIQFLNSSPGLQLLHVYRDWDWDEDLSVTKYTGPQIQLLNLDRLILDVGQAMNLLIMILEQVTFPSSVKWQVTSQWWQLGSETIFKYLPRVAFTNLVVEDAEAISFSLQKSVRDSAGNLSNPIKLTFRFLDYGDMICSVSLKSLVQSFSSITTLELELNPPAYPSPEEFFAFFWYKRILAPFSYQFKFLAVRYKPSHMACDDQEKPGLSYVSKFMPNPGFVNTDGELPYPHLQQLRVQVRGVLNEEDAITLCNCSRARRQAGYPLQISVVCNGIKDNVRSLLEHDGHVRIEIDT